MFKTFRCLIITLFLFGFFISGCASIPESDSNERGFKNVIVMVPDGCSISIQTLARLYKGAPLNLDELNSGAVRTHSANSVITDSAAAATAFATGHKTTVQFLGIGPREEDLLKGFVPTASPYVPVASVLEGAKMRGMSTGLAVTVSITEATPAAYASHVDSRRKYNWIIEQMAHQDIDVVFGGGGRYLLPQGGTFKTSGNKEWSGARDDTEDLIKLLRSRGYSFVDNKDDMSLLKNGRAWGIFNEGHLVPEIDRDELAPEQPSLARMTEKAIEILSQNEKGFFLMVEGSQVDWAGHGNDPVYMVTEFLAFDEAVGKAVDFAKKDGKTLVIIFADHNTGGLALGSKSRFYNEKSYSMQADDFIRTVRNAGTTISFLVNYIYEDNNADTVEITNAFKDRWNLELTGEQAGEILAMGKNQRALVDYINNNFTALGWTSYGHTAEDVPLWAYTNALQSLPHGNIDNTEVARIIASGLNFDLKEISEKLFMDVSDIFPEHEIMDDTTGPVLKIGDYLLPINKDMVIKGEKTFQMNGIVVQSPMINRVFIPEEAVEFINKNGSL